MNTQSQNSDKIIKPTKGMPVLILNLLLYIFFIGGTIFTLTRPSDITTVGIAFIVLAAIYMVFGIFIFTGLKVVKPNEALVLTLFGKYHGTIATNGFYFLNPFASPINPTVKAPTLPAGQVSMSSPSKAVSLKATTLNNEKQKVNDQSGNPIEIGVVVIWKVVDAAKAVLDVEDYKVYVSTQCDSAIRNVARQYPYDITNDGDEKSLRGSSQEIAQILKDELQAKTDIAGIEILDARISHLAYAQEIAAAMLQRQQADAIIDARQKIVEGAVGMVEMALNRLSEKEIVELDEERKAQMVSNLLVVLCSNKDSQPIVNTGSIY